MGQHEHWEAVYKRKRDEELSWYRPHLERSLALLQSSGLGRDAAIVDVGGGTSTFIDDLLDAGYTDVAVLEIAETALAKTRERLGSRAASVQWILGDVTTLALPAQRFDFWHDRAVFHFLVDAEARQRYVLNVRQALRPGGHIVVATFGIGGPSQCSGLDVVRYSAESLHGEFGPVFHKVGSFEETHVTPWGMEQEFVYCYCRT